MTNMLEIAIERARQLSEEQQNAIAELILEEIADDAHWDASFARSPDLFERPAAEAAAEDRQGLTKELDPNAL